MTRPTAFVGALADIRFVREDRTLRAHVALPIREFDAFAGSVGLPPAAAIPPGGNDDGWLAAAPSVALLPCRTARHPDTESDATADAALAHLEDLLAHGRLRLDVRRARRIEALAAAIPFLPLRVERA